ncbi:hypothetical protein ACFXTH_000898 [Malus domestica]
MEHHEEEGGASSEPHGKQDDEEVAARLKEVKKSIEAKMALRQCNLNPEQPALGPARPNPPQNHTSLSLEPTTGADPPGKKRVESSARVHSRYGISVLVTGVAGFVGTHGSATLKCRKDGILGLDCFNDYYDSLLKKARQALLERSRVFIMESNTESMTTLQTRADSHSRAYSYRCGYSYAVKRRKPCEIIF